MRKVPVMVLAGLALLLAGCVNPTPYQPAAGSNGYGFSEQQLDGQTWRVAFAGNSSTPRTTVENGLLYRAAEIALAQGADGFVVVREDVEQNVRYYGTYPYFPPFGYPHNGLFHHHYGRPFYGWGAPLYTTVRPVVNYQAYATVRLYRGAPPAGERNYYNAAEVIQRVGPSLPRPAASAS